MKFNIFEYREDINYQKNNDNVIIEGDYIFIHEEKYSNKFPNKFKDGQGNEAETDYPEQLKNQVFILINQDDKSIYSYEASLKNTEKLIKEYLNIDLHIYLRFGGGIDKFIEKLECLNKITIKGSGVLKLPILKKLLEENEDLSKFDEVKIELSYKQQQKWFNSNTYNKLTQYDISDLTLEGEGDNNIISFNKDKILEHFYLQNINKNENNIYNKDDVFKCLKKELK